MNSRLWIAAAAATALVGLSGCANGMWGRGGGMSSSGASSSSMPSAATNSSSTTANPVGTATSPERNRMDTNTNRRSGYYPSNGPTN